MDSKQDKKLKLGVMGFPVRQSRSPELFYKTFAGRADVLDRFSYDLLEEDTFGKAFKRFQQDYYAVNVTIPYKEPAFMAADEASPQCRAIGAANLLIHQNGRIIAHNTDVLAVTEILNRWHHEQKGLNYSAEVSENGLRGQNGPDYSPEVPKGGPREQNDLNYSPGLKVLVVGCGGAGKAAVAAALSVGASVTIVNRTADTALRFIDYIRAHTSRPDSPSTEHPNSATSHPLGHSSKYTSRGSIPSPVRFTPQASLPEEVRQADFIIYTLPLAIPELERCDFPGKTVLEARYYDPSIKQVPGMTYIPGTEWLRLQALATYRILKLT